MSSPLSLLRSPTLIEHASLRTSGRHNSTPIWLSLRHQSVLSGPITSSKTRARQTGKDVATKLPPHSLLPTRILLRSLLVSTISSHPFLLSQSLSLLKFLNKTSFALFDVRRNPLLRFLLKRSMYDHFCAGENGREVSGTIRNIKEMGFKGVILTYAREIVVDARTQEDKGLGIAAVEDDVQEEKVVHNADIGAWGEGVLETVEMIGKDDFLALKFTGAGATVTKALSAGKPLPDQMADALDRICRRTLERDAQIVVDAEQQSVQPGIDRITVDLMRKYNRNGSAVVYNTYQAYLKSTPANLVSHMEIASKEGFTLGVKLVRGAYMNSEPRQLINDTKEDTDNSFNSIAKGLLRRDYGGFGEGGENSAAFPSVQLFLATHNKESALEACQLHKSRIAADLPTIDVQYGQLLGMADEVSLGLLQLKDDSADVEDKASPKVYKCLSWGTLSDCLSYLLRRAVENQGALERTKSEHIALKSELRRRIRTQVSLST